MNVSNIWIVDSATDRVYEFNGAATRTSGSQSAAATFDLASGNTNPQGIADPPVGWLEAGDLRLEAEAQETSVSTPFMHSGGMNEFRRTESVGSLAALDALAAYAGLPTTSGVDLFQSSPRARSAIEGGSVAPRAALPHVEQWSMARASGMAGAELLDQTPTRKAVDCVFDAWDLKDWNAETMEELALAR